MFWGETPYRCQLGLAGPLCHLKFVFPRSPAQAGCMRQMLTIMKGEINNNRVMVRDVNTPLTPMNRSTKQKISKETQTLNDTMDQLGLINIYRHFTPKQ